MSLLTALNLRPTAALRARSAGAAAKPLPGANPAGARNVPPPGSHAMTVADGSRAEAARLKAALEHRHRAAYDEWQRLQGLSTKLDALVGATKDPAQKADLAAKQTKLGERIAAAERAARELMEHIEVLENPQASAKDVNEVLSAHGSTRTSERREELDLHPHESRKPGEVHETRTATAMVDGTAFVDQREKHRTVGPGGVTQTDTHATEVGRDGHKTRTEHERKVEASLADKKISVETTHKIEVERPGGLVNSRDERTAADIGAEGASRTRSQTVANSDGSSDSASSRVGVERGEGRIGGAASATRTHADALGREKTGTVAGKGGVSASGGVGGYAEGTGSAGTQRKGGFNTKASLGLKSNITCDIDGPDDKGMYTVKLDVVLGAALDAAAGRDKKGGSLKVGVGAQASKTLTMHREVPVHERDIQAYVAALKKANAGHKVSDATHAELQIIATGASQGWEAARRAFEGQALDVGAAVGSSTTLATEASTGASASVSVKGIGVSGSRSETHGRSIKATRDAKGGLEVESTITDASKTARGATLDTGTSRMGASLAQTLETRIGYLVTIPAGADPDGKLLAAFHACKTPADQERFIREHRDRIELTGTKRGTEHGSEKHDTFGAGPVNLDLTTKANLSEDITRDAKGSVVKSEIVGESSIGGSLGVSDTMRVGDSTQDKASATHDDQGHVDLDLQRDKSSTSVLKKLKSLLPFGDDDKEEEAIEPVSEDGAAEVKAKRPKGLVAKAAGGEGANSDVHDVFGIRLGKADLLKIVELANGDAQRWTECAWLFDEKAIKEWSALRGQIAARGKADPAFVADSLARYVGADRGRRMEALLRLVRPGGKVAIGRRAEFPPSLKRFTQVYAELVEKAIETRIAEKRDKDGPEAAGKLGLQWFNQLQQMLSAVQDAGDFSSKSAQMEMMSGINDRKQALLEAMRAAAGGADAGAKADALRHDYTRVRDQLQRYPKLMAPDLAMLAEKLGNRDRFIGATDLLDTLQEMADRYALWSNDYEKALGLAKRAGIAASEVLPFKPDTTAYVKYRRAAGLSD